MSKVALLFSLLVSVLVVNSMAALAGPTTRVSVDSHGNESNGDSTEPSISGNGRFVAFTSAATNLAAECTNANAHIFIHNRATGGTTCASVNSNENQGNNDSSEPSISGNGRIVAFSSTATNLAADCTNGKSHIFLRNRNAGATSCASIDSNGNQGNDDSIASTISNDGRFVAFTSTATNLASACTNGHSHIFLRDRGAQETICISVDSNGNQGNGDSFDAAISNDNHFVAYTSAATNLAAICTNGLNHILVYNRTTGQTTCASVNSNEQQSNDDSFLPTISNDGRFVAFQSSATTLAPECANAHFHIFLRNRGAGQTTCASVDSSGDQGNDDSFFPSISDDGRFVAFYSAATNLASECTNGNSHIFRHGRLTRRTTCASVDASGNQGNGDSFGPSISGNGRFVAYQSSATNLVSTDGNGADDVFLHDFR